MKLSIWKFLNAKYSVLICCLLLVIGSLIDGWLCLATKCYTLFSLSVDLVTAQLFEDTITLQPIQPASGLSACPGQNVTLNCTVVRVTSIPEALPPILTWGYRGIFGIRSDGTSTSNSPHDIFTASFIVLNLDVLSTATIFSVPLSHHNSEMRCQSPMVADFKFINIIISGMIVKS